MKSKFEEILASEGFTYSEEQVNKFIAFTSLIKEWNKKINLTALENEEEIIYKHFIDSLLCVNLNINWCGKKIIDIGTGAGFPGIPLKIYLDNIEMFLFDSLKKRILFLKKVVDELKLKDIYCLHGRAEDLGRDHIYREKFDIVIARAVARLPVLLELCIPLVNKEGFFVALKGPEAIKELKESQYTLEVLGAELVDINEFMIKGINNKRIILTFKKITETPSKYPRKAGIPQKRPLL